MILARLPFSLMRVVLGAIMLGSALGEAQAPTESRPSSQSAPASSGNTSPNNKPLEKPKVVTVVTVTGEPLNPSLAPASLSVLDTEQVQNSDASTSADIIRESPFINLEQNGSEGSLSTLTIRGGKPNLVLMLIDGIPINDLTNLLGGSFDFSTLLTRDIEQVEIVRGPLSSAYGSEAMSGVINVITKPSHYETNLTAGLETGSFGTAGINFGAEGSQGRLGYKLSGQFLRVGDQVESDAFSASSFAASSDFVRNSRESLSWTLRWIQFQDSSSPPNGGGPEFSVLKIPETDNAGNFLAGFHFQHRFNQRWSERIDVDVFSRGDRSYTPPILDSPNPGPLSQPSDLATTRFTRPRLNAQSAFDLSPKWTGHFNAQIADEIGSNNSLLEYAYSSKFSTNRGVTNASGDLEYLTNRMTAMAAIGIGKTSGFTTQFAPRVGVAVRVAKNTIAKASWGEGYRVPDLYALKNPEVGNPALLPEKAMGMDTGVEHTFNHCLTLSGTYYNNLFTNLIDFSTTEFRLVNRTRVRTAGVETAASFSLPHGIQLKAWGSSLNWDIESTSEPLRDEPDWQAGFNMAGRFRQFRASSTTLWAGRRYDYQLPVPNITTVGGYSVTNLILGYEGLRRVALFARVDNVFDSHFHEYLGFPNPGIACRVGLTYRLR